MLAKCIEIAVNNQSSNEIIALLLHTREHQNQVMNLCLAHSMKQGNLGVFKLVLKRFYRTDKLTDEILNGLIY